MAFDIESTDIPFSVDRTAGQFGVQGEEHIQLAKSIEQMHDDVTKTVAQAQGTISEIKQVGRDVISFKQELTDSKAELTEDLNDVKLAAKAVNDQAAGLQQIAANATKALNQVQQDKGEVAANTAKVEDTFQKLETELGNTYDRLHAELQQTWTQARHFATLAKQDSSAASQYRAYMERTMPDIYQAEKTCKEAEGKLSTAVLATAEEVKKAEEHVTQAEEYAKQALANANVALASGGDFNPTGTEGEYPDTAGVTRDTMWILDMPVHGFHTFISGALTGQTAHTGDFLFLNMPAGNWKLLKTGKGQVMSVNGHNGPVVSLEASDVDAYSKVEADSRFAPIGSTGGGSGTGGDVNTDRYFNQQTFKLLGDLQKYYPVKVGIKGGRGAKFRFYREDMNEDSIARGTYSLTVEAQPMDSRVAWTAEDKWIGRTTFTAVGVDGDNGTQGCNVIAAGVFNDSDYIYVWLQGDTTHHFESFEGAFIEDVNIYAGVMDGLNIITYDGNERQVLSNFSWIEINGQSNYHTGAWQTQSGPTMHYGTLGVNGNSLLTQTDLANITPDSIGAEAKDAEVDWSRIDESSIPSKLTALLDHNTIGSAIIGSAQLTDVSYHTSGNQFIWRGYGPRFSSLKMANWTEVPPSADTGAGYYKLNVGEIDADNGVFDGGERVWSASNPPTPSQLQATKAFAPVNHIHDGRYYSQQDVDAKIADLKAEMRREMQGSAAVPVGMATLWTGSKHSIPDNYHALDGGSIRSDLYPDLAKLWGIVPDVKNWIDLPDWQDRFVKGASSRNAANTFQDAQMLSHTHTAELSSYDYGRVATDNYDYGRLFTETGGHHFHKTGVVFKDGTLNTAYGTDSLGEGKTVDIITLPNGTTVDRDQPSATVYRTSLSEGHSHGIQLGRHNHHLNLGSHNHNITLHETGGDELRPACVTGWWVIRVK